MQYGRMSLLRIVLCLSVSAIPLLAQSLVPGETDTFAAEWAVAADGSGKPVESGRIPNPWAANFTEERGSARVRFVPDPVHRRKSFELVNLGGDKTARLVTDPALVLENGKTYTLKLDLLTRGEAVGTLRILGAVNKTLPLPTSRGSWIPLRETFVANGETLRLEFSNSRRGEENSLHISRISLVRQDPPIAPISAQEEEPRSTLHATYQREYAALGGLSFLNAADPDVLLRSATGGNIFPVTSSHILPPPFESLRRFEVTQPGTTPQAVRLSVTNRDPILKGETLMMVFEARGELLPGGTPDGWGPVAQAVIHGPSDVPGDAPLKWQWSEPNRLQDLSSVWQRFHAPARWAAPRDLKPGEVRFEIWVGQKHQRVEIGGLALLSIKNADRSRFPLDSPSYMGSGETQEWRAEAEARIERSRKADLRVHVPGAPNARIAATMKSHRFHLGSSVSLYAWHGRSPQRAGLSPADTELYRTRSMAYFNRITLEDAFTSAFWETADPSAAESFRKSLGETLDYYRNRNVAISAGPLWRPAREPLPGDSLAERLRFAGDRVGDWVAASDTSAAETALSTLGPEALPTFFQRVAELQPGARLWIEEQDMISSPGKGAWLRQQNAPLQGLALNASGGLLRDISPEMWWQLMDLLHEQNGLRFRFTQLQVPIRNPKDAQQQAYQLAHLRDTLLTLFASSAVEGVDFAGFWAGVHPYPASALWDEKWQLTPIGTLVIDLFYKQWWTQAEGNSDAEGRWQTRAFQGTYEVIVTHPDGRSLRRTVVLPPEGLDVEFSF